MSRSGDLHLISGKSLTVNAPAVQLAPGNGGKLRVPYGIECFDELVQVDDFASGSVAGGANLRAFELRIKTVDGQLTAATATA